MSKIPVIFESNTSLVEGWKSVKGYENYYEISTKGNIRSLDRVVYHPVSKKLTLKGKMLKKTLSTNGYYTVSLTKLGKSKVIYIHQLVAVAFLAHEINGMTLVVNHIDYIKTNNNVSNLEIVTQRDNCILKRKKGSSMYTGVARINENKWVSRIRIKVNQKYLGSFTNEIKAAEAYTNAYNDL